MIAYRFGEFELRPEERLLIRSGEPLIVGARAFDLLTYLVDHRDRVVPKAELLDQVWPGIAVADLDGLRLVGFDPSLDYGSLRFGNPSVNQDIATFVARQKEARERLMVEPDVTPKAESAPKGKRR